MTTPAGGSRLDALDVLVGRWNLTSSLGRPDVSPLAVTSFEWLEGRGFLIQRWRVDHPDAPDGIAVIGYDDQRATFLQHYFDSRGVARVYEMSFQDGTWRLERIGSDFSQRFIGVFNESGDTISGTWEISVDGTTWEHDFDLVYRRPPTVTEHADLPSAFEEIVRDNQYMVLATSDESGLPWATPVWFATEDFHHYYWVSHPNARHSTNLAARAELGITIFDSQQASGTGRGVYLSAVGAPVPEDDLDEGLATFSGVSERGGDPAWTRSDVTGTARHRLYRATALERFVLSEHDERIPVPQA